MAPILTNQSTVDTSSEMDENSWWNLWNTSHRTKDDNDPVSSELFARAAEQINKLTRQPGCRVLEIACGAGSLSRRLVYSSYHGIDLSSAAIDLARQRSLQTSLSPGVTPTYEVADFHQWQACGLKFDVVVCVDAIAYFRDRRFTMKKIADALRPHGQLVLTTINPFVYRRIRRTNASSLASGFREPLPFSRRAA